MQGNSPETVSQRLQFSSNAFFGLVKNWAAALHKGTFV